MGDSRNPLIPFRYCSRKDEIIGINKYDKVAIKIDSSTRKKLTQGREKQNNCNNDLKCYIILQNIIFPANLTPVFGVPIKLHH